MKKQSAFSLIEVLMALVIFSIGFVCSWQVLFQHHQNASTIEQETLMLWIIRFVESLRAGNSVQHDDLIKTLKEVAPKADLIMAKKVNDTQWVYTIKIKGTYQTFDFQVITEE